MASGPGSADRRAWPPPQRATVPARNTLWCRPPGTGGCGSNPCSWRRPA